MVQLLDIDFCPLMRGTDWGLLADIFSFICFQHYDGTTLQYLPSIHLLYSKHTFPQSGFLIKRQPVSWSVFKRKHRLKLLAKNVMAIRGKKMSESFMGKLYGQNQSLCMKSKQLQRMRLKKQNSFFWTQSNAFHTDEAMLRRLSPAGLIKTGPCDEAALKCVVFISVKEMRHKQSNTKPRWAVQQQTNKTKTFKQQQVAVKKPRHSFNIC